MAQVADLAGAEFSQRAGHNRNRTRSAGNVENSRAGKPPPGPEMRKPRPTGIGKGHFAKSTEEQQSRNIPAQHNTQETAISAAFAAALAKREAGR